MYMKMDDCVFSHRLMQTSSCRAFFQKNVREVISMRDLWNGYNKLSDRLSPRNWKLWYVWTDSWFSI